MKNYSVSAGIIFFVVIIGVIIIAALGRGNKASEYQATGRVLATASVSGSFGNTNQILVKIKNSKNPLTVLVGNRFYRKHEIVTLSCTEFESKAISCHVQDKYLNK